MSAKIRDFIDIPEGLNVSVVNEIVYIKKEEASLSFILPKCVMVQIDGNKLSMKYNDLKGASAIKFEKDKKMFFGLVRAKLNNMMSGLLKPWSRTMDITGVGFKAFIKQGNMVQFFLGYSHDIFYVFPEKISIKIENDTVLTLTSIDKILLGNMVADVSKNLRPVNKYKRKGIFERGVSYKFKEMKK